MARTAIPVNVIDAYQAGTVLTQTAGDNANYHSIDASVAPKLHLFVRNTAANSIDFTLELPQGVSGYNNAALSKSYTVTDSQWILIVLDVPPDLMQDGTLIHIDSDDVNFAELNFTAYTWQHTPRNSAWQRPV